MWHFFSRTLSWLRGVPPMKTWHSKPSIFTPMVVITAWICTAISRVGARIRICRDQGANVKAAAPRATPGTEPRRFHALRLHTSHAAFPKHRATPSRKAKLPHPRYRRRARGSPAWPGSPAAPRPGPRWRTRRSCPCRTWPVR